MSFRWFPVGTEGWYNGYMTTSTKKQASLWHLEVAPLTSIPLTRGQTFTYASEYEVRPGALVSVPVSVRTVKGVVFAAHSPEAVRKMKPLPFRIKKIFSVVQEGFLTPEQLRLAAFISREYFTSLGRCLVHFAPQIATARSSTELPTPEKIAPKKIRLTGEQKTIIETIARKDPTDIKRAPKPFYLFGPASSGKTEVYMRAIEKRLGIRTTSTRRSESHEGNQALVLVPELTLIPQEEARYGAYFGKENIAILHSHIAPGVFYETWGRIARGEVRVIIGTRQALFAPFRKLGLIVVDEEQDDAYKQWDMSPRYDARTLAEELARSHDAGLVFGSATPSLDRFHKTQTGDYTLLTLSPLSIQPKYSIELVNLRMERWRKNFSSLSAPLVEEISFALKHKHQALLFINRQGASSFSVCEECKSVIRCPSCERALVYDTREGTYRCLHCTHQSSAFPTCSQCRSMNFRNVGTGTQRVEKEVLKRFPFARVARIDRQTMQKKGSQEKVYRDFAQGKIDILIGTQMATKGWDLPGVGLVGIIDADSLFAFPDFKTDENAFQHLVQAAGRMARIGSTLAGKAIVQTFHPESRTLQFVKDKDFIAFYREHIGPREDLGYPPFGRLIKLVLQEEDEKKIDKEAKKTYDQLSRVTEGISGLRVFSPQAPFIAKVRNKHRRQIIIRLKEHRIPDSLSDAIVKISKTWTVDVDPVSIT